MKVKEIMTQDVITVDENISIFECARKMREHDIGVLPVCLKEQVVGVVTDRDLVVRSLAEAIDSFQLSVKDIMSTPVIYCLEDDEIEKAIRIMEVKQVRRILVLNKRKKIVGILSLTDIAVRSENWNLSAEALEKITEVYPH